jgi:hypothetical protein
MLTRRIRSSAAAPLLAVVVWLDFSNFGTDLDDLTGCAGLRDFDSTEKAQIESNIQSLLESIYDDDDFDISFTTTEPTSAHFPHVTSVISPYFRTRR